jgi:hypothetical protein
MPRDMRNAAHTVVIAEAHYEIAHALMDVVTLAGCIPVTVTHFDSVRTLDVPQSPSSCESIDSYPRTPALRMLLAAVGH